MTGDKLTFQVKFWAVIGPLICLFALFVFFYKSSNASLYLPLFCIIGVPLCWKWKLWGFAGSAAMIGVVLSYQYSEIPLDDRFWQIGMGISMAISLFITTLAYEEVEAIVSSILIESRSRLENLWKVDEKQKWTEEELQKKRDHIRELEVKVRSFQKLLDMSAEEMAELRRDNENVLQEMHQIRKKLEVQKEDSKQIKTNELENFLEQHLQVIKKEVNLQEMQTLQKILNLVKARNPTK